MSKHNPYCCGYHCTSATEEVRVLPDNGRGTLILCNACFHYERRAEIRHGRQPELLAWSDLECYDHTMTLLPRRMKSLTHMGAVEASRTPLLTTDREHKPIRAFLFDMVDWFESHVKPKDWPHNVREAKKTIEATKHVKG